MPREFLSGYRVGKPDGGPECEALERELEAYYGVPYARVFNSATSALIGACEALAVRRNRHPIFGTRVCVPALTMSASAAAIIHAGAEPAFLDVGDDYLMDRLPDGVVSMYVHLFGHHGHVLDAHPPAVIHDCAQSPSLKPNPERAADIWVHSFNQWKVVSCGEGGYALTFSRTLADRLHAVRNHGECFTPDILGFNFRMTEPVAAIARREFRDLDRRLDARRKWAEDIRKKHDLSADDGNVDWFLYPFRCKPERREEIVARIPGSRAGYHKPIYQLPYFASRYPGVSCSNAEKIESELVVIDPMAYGL